MHFIQLTNRLNSQPIWINMARVDSFNAIVDPETGEAYTLIYGAQESLYRVKETIHEILGMIPDATETIYSNPR